FGIGLAAAVYEGREMIYERAHGPIAAAGLGMRDAFIAAAIVAGLATILVIAGARTPQPSPPGA
ncbi:MAG: hypothetical protein ABI960_00300, partial [Candidatus Eisenbacteria bacterium]